MQKCRGVDVGWGCSYRELEKFGESLRTEGLPGVGKLAPMDRIDALTLFDEMDAEPVSARRGARYPLVRRVVPDEAFPEEIGGATNFVSGKFVVSISNRTYQGLSVGEARARWTVVHEFGHTRLHPDVLVTRATLPHISQAALRRGDADHKIYRDSEWQCDSLTAALLMPLSALLDLRESGTLDEAVLVRQFGVSYEAAAYRIDNLRRGALT